MANGFSATVWPNMVPPDVTVVPGTYPIQTPAPAPNEAPPTPGDLGLIGGIQTAPLPPNEAAPTPFATAVVNWQAPAAQPIQTTYINPYTTQDEQNLFFGIQSPRPGSGH